MSYQETRQRLVTRAIKSRDLDMYTPTKSHAKLTVGSKELASNHPTKTRKRHKSTRPPKSMTNAPIPITVIHDFALSQDSCLGAVDHQCAFQKDMPT